MPWLAIAFVATLYSLAVPFNANADFKKDLRDAVIEALRAAPAAKSNGDNNKSAQPVGSGNKAAASPLVRSNDFFTSKATAAETVTIFVDGVSKGKGSAAATATPEFYDFFVGASNDRTTNYLHDSPLANAIRDELGGAQESVVWSGSQNDTFNLDRAISETVTKIMVADSAGKEIYLVTHSMGTVVGYLALARYKDLLSKTPSSRYRGIASFVTLASPLGSSFLVRELDAQNRRLNIPKVIASHRTRESLMIRGDWINVHAHNDPIGTQLSLPWVDNYYLPFSGGPFAAHSFPYQDDASARKIADLLEDSRSKLASAPIDQMTLPRTAEAGFITAVPVKDHGNDFSGASPVAVGTVAEASINGKGDKDYFRFMPSYRAVYVIYSTGDTDTSGELYDADFNLKRSEGGGGEEGNFRIVYRMEKGHAYYVTVRGRPGRYNLHIDGPEGGTVSDDHGFSGYSATLVKPGSKTKGRIDVENDEDYFKFIPGHSATYIIYTTGDMYANGSLYDADFNLRKAEGGGGENRNFRIAYRIEKGQTYYIMVRGGGWRGLGRYNLHIDGPEGGTVSDDHGFSSYSATLVKPGSKTEGRIDVQNDQDYFKFISGHHATYVIYTTGEARTGGELYNADFNLKKSIGGSGESQITYRVEKGQTYYVRVRGEPGRYSLNIDEPNDSSETVIPPAKR